MKRSFVPDREHFGWHGGFTIHPGGIRTGNGNCIFCNTRDEKLVCENVIPRRHAVTHAYMHLIPRYRGDVPDPRGGIRNVIPHKAHYERKQRKP